MASSLVVSSSTPPAAEEDHPALQELKRLDPSLSSSSSSSSDTALCILNHLLVSGELTEKSLQRAYRAIVTSTEESGREDGNSGEDMQDEEGTAASSNCTQDSGTKEASTRTSNAKAEKQSPSNTNNKKTSGKNKKNVRQQSSRPPRCRRHVALQIYYDGANYSGLAENVGQESDQSVERALFQALAKASFVDATSDPTNDSNNNDDNKKGKNHVVVTNTKYMREQCRYSRCGRTDRGVSAAGQVVALTLPSAFAHDASWDEAGQRLLFSPPQKQEECTVTSSNETTGDSSEVSKNSIEKSRTQTLPGNSHDSVQVWIPIKAGKKQGKDDNAQASDAQQQRKSKTMTEYPYDVILNNLLPPDIRVLGWTPVSEDFSARFSATTRTYRYFFTSRQVPSPWQPVSSTAQGDESTTTTASTMNLSAMRKGLEYLVGDHDFRNFCKMDVEKVYNFRRIIHSADLVEIKADKNSNATVCYFQIVGQAFLWHQIRCIVSVLFMIGRGLEQPEVIPELLDVAKYPGKPSYAMADEAPLVLHHCGYRNLTMGYSISNLAKLTAQQEGEWQDLLLQAARIRNNLQTIEQEANVRVSDVVSFGSTRLEERRKKMGKYSQKSGRCSTTSSATDLGPPPFASLEFVSWGEARIWLESHGLIPELYSLQRQGSGNSSKGGGESSLVHVPLLQRAKGTTYEEKVAALKSSASAKRKGRYEENILKKRKTKEEDQAFYDHMTSQGGTAS